MNQRGGDSESETEDDYCRPESDEQCEESEEAERRYPRRHRRNVRHLSPDLYSRRYEETEYEYTDDEDL